MNNGKIYELIGTAMRKVGAIGKDSTATNINGKQMYKFRGIDAVYNALNPVMSDLGLFITPEVLEQTREERKTTNGGNLIYSILRVRFTMYAPDGSNVSGVVTGEGMDSGDKASNKAMSAAMKYFCFQTFMIPTEEMVDPDADVHNVAPKDEKQNFTPPPAANGTVTNANNVPPTAPPQNPPQNTPPVKQTESMVFLMKAIKQLREDRGITAKENNKLFADQFKALIDAGLVPDKKMEEYTLEEAKKLIDAMYANFPPTSAEMNK